MLGLSTAVLGGRMLKLETGRDGAVPGEGHNRMFDTDEHILEVNCQKIN